MKIKVKAALGAAMLAAAALCQVSAEESGPTFFLCMKSGESTAFISYNGTSGSYRNMESSNGAVVKTLIIDGSTYLPFRFVSELAGWKEGKVPDGGGTDNTFEYNNGELRICVNKKTYTKNIGEPFEFIVKGENEPRIFSIQNIGGSLYMPLRYIADIINAKTAYDSNDGNVYFASSDNVLYNFVNKRDKSLKFEKTMIEEYNLYDNPSMYSEMYLNSDGVTRTTVSEEMGLSEAAYSCVSRYMSKLYFIGDKDLKVYTKNELSSSAYPIYFAESNGTKVDLKADVILTDGDYLWGITASENGTQGRLFHSDLYGDGFKFISDNGYMYNLLYRKHNGQKYIFCMNSDYSTMLRIDTENMQIDKLSLFDIYGMQLKDISFITIGENAVFYVNMNDGKLHYLPIIGDIYSDMAITFTGDVTIEKYGRSEIGRIKSMNYDTGNNILYFTAENSNGGSILYYYDPASNATGRLRSSGSGKMRVSIIETSTKSYVVNCDGDAKNNVVVCVNSDDITIDGNIKLAK